MRFMMAALAALALTTGAFGQGYPDKPIRIVSGTQTGTSGDLAGRMLAQKLTAQLGQPVVFESRPGANGQIAANYVKTLPADGTTILYAASSTLITGPIMSKNVGFDTFTDFTPISLAVGAPLYLVANSELHVDTTAALIGYAKKHPGEINFGSAGNGSTPHLSGELLKAMADINIVHVPYRGTGPAMNDLIGGHIQMFFDLLPASLQQIQSGKVRALANAGAKRPAVLANLPTVAEQGLPGFDASSWEGLVAPVGTPAPVQAKLIAEVRKVLQSPDIAERIAALGSQPGTAFGKDFGTFMQAETAKWAAVIKKSGAHAD
jgi:tripartite-type tricarboxylate transporter receptor subunit TctC